MQIDFQPPHHWQELNEKASTLLGVEAVGGAVKLLAGLSAALCELTVGLLKQFPHKKKIYLFKNMDPVYEAATTLLSREGCAIQALEPNLLLDKAALEAAISSDGLLVLCSEDDPMLGRLHDLTFLQEVIEAKKVILLKVSHAHHRFLPLPTAYTRQMFHVHSLGSHLAAVFHSARVRWPIQFSESVALAANALSEVEKLKRQELVNPDIVEKFEASLPAESKRVFASGAARIPDRVVLYWPDMDGFAVITRLAERLKHKLAGPGESSSFETTSLNRWRGVRTMDWLRDFGFNDEMIRGTVIIDQRYVDQNLAAHLSIIRAEILKIQNG
ncbi:MAG: hypothetical protein AB7N80_04330 [Bdellovibrionales bacterium]